MSTYLTVNYFIGELAIPNITGSSPAATANANNLKWFIGEHEPQFLEMLLGETLYAEFSAGMAAGTPDPKWTALKNKIYLHDTQNGIYLSPAANYVYYHYQRDHITTTTNTGEAKAAKEAGVPQQVSNVMKMVTAWNRMYDKVLKIWAWLEEEAQVETYPSFDPTQEDPFGMGDRGGMNMFNL